MSRIAILVSLKLAGQLVDNWMYCISRQNPRQTFAPKYPFFPMFCDTTVIQYVIYQVAL